MNPELIDGGCLCGSIRYRVTGTPLALSLCHCESCRRAAGAPSVAWVVLRASDFQVLSGTPAQYESSPGVLRTFCERCGTSLTYQRKDERDTIDITTASLDHPQIFPPEREIWTVEKIEWDRINDALRQYPRSSRSGSA